MIKYVNSVCVCRQYNSTIASIPTGITYEITCMCVCTSPGVNQLACLSNHLNSWPVSVPLKTEVFKVENSNNSLNVSAFLMVDNMSSDSQTGDSRRR